MSSPFDQSAAPVRFEWGLAGARELVGPGAVCVVVDVLSFTTSVDVACARGATVLPYRWADPTAVSYAAAQGAVLAVGRRSAGPGAVSLSPVTLRDAAVLDRVVLPSPNGSTICAEVAASGATVVAGCLRNAAAVGAWAAARIAPTPATSLEEPSGATPRRHGPRALVVVAAGEKWADGSLRPCAEDLWGAGAVLAAVVGWWPEAELSPEAGVALAAYEGMAGDLTAALEACASGRELRESGFGEDVALSGQVDSSGCVPVLDESRAFRNVSPTQ